MSQSNKTILSLIALIDDPDPVVYGAVLGELRAQGGSTVPDLRRALSDIDGALARQRLTEVIREFQSKPLNDLIKLIQIHQQTGSDIDLEEALFLLDGFGHPEADRGVVSSYLDDVALKIHEVFISQAPANDLTHVLSMHSVMFEGEGFHGAKSDYYDPLNSYISTVVDRKEGIPVSLAAIELLLADRVGLQLAGVAMPYHFVLFSPDLGLFIDPFHEGTFISRDDCITFLQRSGLAFNDSMLEPVSNLDIVIRMIRNLSFAHGRKLELWEAQTLEGALRDVTPTQST